MDENKKDINEEIEVDQDEYEEDDTSSTAGIFEMLENAKREAHKRALQKRITTIVTIAIMGIVTYKLVAKKPKVIFVMREVRK